MGSEAKWQIGRREAKKKRSRKKKKEKWKESGKKGKEGKGGKEGEGTETGEGGLGWLYRSTSVWNCLWHCTTCRFTVRVWSWFETFPCFQDSQALYTIIYNHCTVCTTSLANLWQVEFLQGEWEHSKRGIGTGNIRHASHVGYVFHVMIFDASFRDGKNTENAWERLFGDESHSRIFTVHKKRVSPGPVVAVFTAW